VEEVHNNEFYNLYSSQNYIRMIKTTKMRLKEFIARMWKIRNEYINLIRKPEGNRQLGKPRRRREY